MGKSQIQSLENSQLYRLRVPHRCRATLSYTKTHTITEMIVSLTVLHRAQFLNFSTINILGWMILHFGGLSYAQWDV